MSLNDVLFVTRNCHGQCEENFLSTVDEFIAEYCSDDVMYSDSLRSVLAGSEPYKWAGTYYDSLNNSYDLRLCCGSEDLLNFLSGEYNNSVVKMEDRLPGTSEFYRHWYWENRSDKFSELALGFVFEYARSAGSDFYDKLSVVVPDFSLLKAERKVSLNEVIENAEKRASLSLKEKNDFRRLEI